MFCSPLRHKAKENFWIPSRARSQWSCRRQASLPLPGNFFILPSNKGTQWLPTETLNSGSVLGHVSMKHCRCFPAWYPWKCQRVCLTKELPELQIGGWGSCLVCCDPSDVASHRDPGATLLPWRDPVLEKLPGWGISHMLWLIWTGCSICMTCIMPQLCWFCNFSPFSDTFWPLTEKKSHGYSVWRVTHFACGTVGSKRVACF